MAEIPLVVVNVQRGGPSTGQPTKAEQGDLMTAIFGSHGDAPKVVMAPATIEDCFYSIITARKIAETFNMVVVVLTDAEPRDRRSSRSRGRSSARPGWRRRSTRARCPQGAKPYDWDETTGLARRFIPGQPGGMHTLTGLAHDRDSHVAYDAEINEQALRARSLKLAALAEDAEGAAGLRRCQGRPADHRLGQHQGRDRGSRRRACAREGSKVSSMHLQFLQPLPPGIKEAMSGFKQVMTIEGNWSDRPERRDHRREQPPLLGARDAAALALPGRRRLLERSARPADQARRPSTRDRSTN